MITNKKRNPIITETFIRCRKLNISLVFTIQSQFKIPEDIRLNCAHFFITKTPHKQKLQQIAFNHSSDTDYNDFMNLYKKCTGKPYFFLMILCFRKNLSERIQKLIMTIDNKITDEKLQYYINTEAARISALSSGKNDKSN